MQGLTTCLRLSATRMNTMAQRNLGKKWVYFSSQLSGHILSLREVRAETQARNLEVVTEAEVLEERGLLQPALYTTQDHG